MTAPAGIRPPTAAGNALAAIQASREVAEVQAAMVIARTFPRDPMQAMDRLLNACTRPTLANDALYSYARGGQDVTGPSIRLAEAAAQCWGNLQFGVRELEQRDGESTVEAFAWDIETNTRQVKVFQVSHSRHTRKGVQKLTDPRDIYEMVANQGARRLRACILGVIPGDVIEAAKQQCEQTMKATADTSPEAQKQLLDRFAEFNVSKAQIEKRIQRRLDSIQPAQVVQLRKVYLSLKDGMSKAADWFEEDPGTGAVGIAPPAQLPAAEVQPVSPQQVQAQATASTGASPVEQGADQQSSGQQAEGERPRARAQRSASAPATAAAPAPEAEQVQPAEQAAEAQQEFLS